MDFIASCFKTGLNQIFDFFGGIVDNLIDWVLKLVNSLLGGLADLIGNWLSSQGLTIQFPAAIFNVLNEITLGIGYILPVKQLMPIVNFMIAFYVAKIIFAVYQLIAKTVIKRVKVKV